MRRVLATALALLALGAGAVALTGAGEGEAGARYWVELDNAFGLVEGGDLKVAGVRAGVITGLELDRRTKRALVGIRIDEEGFGQLRRDVRCESRPQSLVGEYFLDCLPGTARAVLPEGSRIPVAQTGSTVAPDLVNTVLRRPFRERLAIIIGELGAAAAGNGKALNETFRRASPALRQTDRVLATLARERRTIGQLAQDAERVVGALARQKEDVGRFVVEARDTAKASAARADDIAAGFRELPGFLERLQPSMRALGRAADGQAASLQRLRETAPGLTRLLDGLVPFANASRPALKALGEASGTGRQAVRALRPVVQQLRQFTRGTPELAKNLAIVLEHLDDREWAVEADPRSPGGKGYTGLEALLTYVYDQTLSTNVFDSAQHYLKISVFLGECADYQSLESLKEHPEIEERCGARVGPSPLGIVHPDPTRKAETPAQARRRRAQDRRSPDRADAPAPRLPAFTPAPSAGDQPAPEEPTKAIRIPGLPPIELPPILGGGKDEQEGGQALLDLLLGDGR